MTVEDLKKNKMEFINYNDLPFPQPVRDLLMSKHKHFHEEMYTPKKDGVIYYTEMDVLEILLAMNS